MKKLLLCLSILLTLMAPRYSQATGSASKIKEVTVYLNGARISRTANVSLAPGTNEIILDNLSNDIDANGIEVQTPSGAVILAVNFRINDWKYLQKTDEEKKTALALDSVQMKHNIMLNEIESYRSELKLLEANHKITLNEKGDFIKDIDEWMELCHKRTLEIKNKITRLRVHEKELKNTLEMLKYQTENANVANRKPAGEIVLKISSTAHTTAELNFSYYVGSAYWIPLYSLRAQKEGDPVQLIYDGQVSQTTGEIWKDVKLKFSTGYPSLGGQKPSLARWEVGKYVPVLSLSGAYTVNGTANYSTFTNAVKDLNASGLTAPVTYNVQSGDYTEQTGPNYTKPTNYRDMNINQHQLNTTFEIVLKYTILPDGKVQQVRVQQYNLPATYEYVVSPKLEKDPFLVAQVTGWEDLNLLAGESNIFFEGAYIGKSYIDPASTSDTLTLSFGRDNKVVVERTKLKEQNRKQILGGHKMQTYSYEIALKNLKSTNVKLTVEDQFPVSNNKDIEVKLDESQGAEHDLQEGKLTWKLELKANETRKVRFTYTIKSPKSWVISNL